MERNQPRGNDQKGREEMDEQTKKFYRRSEAYLKTMRVVSIFWMTTAMIPMAIFGGHVNLTLRWWAILGLVSTTLHMIGSVTTGVILDAKESTDSKGGD